MSIFDVITPPSQTLHIDRQHFKTNGSISLLWQASWLAVRFKTGPTVERTDGYVVSISMRIKKKQRGNNNQNCEQSGSKWLLKGQSDHKQYAGTEEASAYSRDFWTLMTEKFKHSHIYRGIQQSGLSSRETCVSKKKEKSRHNKFYRD